jgi:hypothetical protein
MKGKVSPEVTTPMNSSSSTKYQDSENDDTPVGGVNMERDTWYLVANSKGREVFTLIMFVSLIYNCVCTPFMYCMVPEITEPVFAVTILDIMVR